MTVPRVKDTYDAAQKQKGEFDAEYRIVLQDGTIKHLHTIGHPVLSESGDVVEYVGTGMDVTEQRQAQAALETAFEEIKRLKDRLQDENLALREELDQTSMFEEIVGASPALKSVLSHLSKVAPTDSTVLVSGETGTGKELIARAIHKHSRRGDRAFITLNCAATPPSLIASELFGHEKGAFTGAVQQRRGRFELAHNGTIFLDEIGEIPMDTQVALLRVLQEHQLERVGGSRPIPVDVRVVAATNRDLSLAIAEGSFRSDLFYRLNVFPIQVPPLRKRREDIPILVEYFVKRFAEKMAKRIHRIDKHTLDLCDRYPWPGNIRELQNIVERSVILCSGDTFSIDEAWLPSQTPLRTGGSGPLPADAAGSGEGDDRDRPSEEPRKSRGASRGCCRTRHSRLDAGIEDQAAWHREAQIHDGVLTYRGAEDPRLSPKKVVSTTSGVGSAYLVLSRRFCGRVPVNRRQETKKSILWRKSLIDRATRCFSVHSVSVAQISAIRRARQRGAPAAVIARAWTAQQRLRRRYRRLAATRQTETARRHRCRPRTHGLCLRRLDPVI